MSKTEWQDKFSSIVKQTETNLDRVKQRLTSAKLNRTMPADALSKFMVADQSMSNVPGCPFHESTSVPSMLWRFNGSESHESSMVAPVLHSGSTEDATYIPLHQSASIMTLLQNRIDDQSRSIETLTKCLRKHEEEKDSFRREIQNLKDEMERIRSGAGGKEAGFLLEQSLDVLRQEMKTEFRLTNQKYNYLKNRDEELSVAMDTKNGSLSSMILDVQRCTQEEVASIRKELQYFEKRLSKLEEDFAQLSLARPKPSEVNGFNVTMMNDSWPVTRQPNGLRGKGSVSFARGFDGQRFYDAPSNQVDEVKNSFKKLQRKLISLEKDISPENGGVRSDFRKKPRSLLPRKIRTPSPSDFDLSTATDLLTFSNIGELKSNGSMTYDQNLTLASDLSSGDDLTLEDL